MAMLFINLVSVTPLSNLPRISLLDRSTSVRQGFLYSNCFGTPRLTADQENGLPIILLLPLTVRDIYYKPPE